ncbi:MAG: hypothetical protein R3304_07335, partial [Longimicrobiales bacterium]|nr:hypothetical protein [Longimicrobiales bacterium]
MNRRSEDRNAGSVLFRLSGEPGTSLGERVRHHGARTALLVALAVVVTVLFPPAEVMEVAPYEEGMVASEDVIAQIPFSVPKTPAELEEDRREAAEDVPPTFNERPAVADSVTARLGRFFDRIDEASADADTSEVAAILRENRVSASPSQMELILNESRREALRTAAQRAAREIIPRGMADPAELADITTDVIYVRTGPENQEIRPLSEVITAREFYDQAFLYLPSGSPPDAQELLRLILNSHLAYSLVPDIVATETAREAARESVSVTKANVLEGEAIVRAAETIGQATRERLIAYQSDLRDAGL